MSEPKPLSRYGREEIDADLFTCGHLWLPVPRKRVELLLAAEAYWRNTVKSLPLRYVTVMKSHSRNASQLVLICPVCDTELIKENCFEQSAHSGDCAWQIAQESA